MIWKIGLHLTGWRPWRWTCCLEVQVLEELEVLPPLCPPHFHSGQTGMPPTLYCSLNPRQTHESKEKMFSCPWTADKGRTMWVTNTVDSGGKKTSGHFYQMSRTPTQCGTVILTLNPTLWCIVQRTAMRSGHSATCHGCKLQKWLCRHFDGHAVFQVRLVPFDGCLTVFWLYSTHSELCGL